MARLTQHDYKVISNLLSTQDICKLFGVQPMTIWNWRKKLQMPTVVLRGASGHNVRFNWDDVLIWAEQHDKATLFDDPDKIPH